MNTTFHNTTRSSKSFEEQWYDWKQRPTEEGMSAILQGLEPTISSALMSFTNGDESLLPRARIIAAQSLTNYDPKQGASLKTYIYNNLKGLQRYKAERSAVVHIPENVRLDANDLYKYRQGFQEENGREPTVEEISDQLGFSKRRLTKAEGYGKEYSSSQMTSDKGDVNINLKDDIKREKKNKTDKQTVIFDQTETTKLAENTHLQEKTDGKNCSSGKKRQKATKKTVGENI